jgi:hypothetical protein
MAKNTLTFELGGRVEISSFADGIAAFRRLVTALTPKNAGVTWVVDDLQPGSAVVTLRGEALDPQAVERIVDDYEKIGAALEWHGELPSTNSRVSGAAGAIQSLTATAEYVRFQTHDVDHTVYRNGYTLDRVPPTVSIGVVTGRIQTLSNRTGLRFNLYDTLHDKAVACYLAAGQEELMREAWGRRATVTGRISREARTGRPIAVRQIVGVDVLDEVGPGSYLNARGVVPWQPESRLPENIIRELRDA